MLTTVWCELMADRHLFRPHFVKSRDLKILAVLAPFLGGFIGRSLLDKIGFVDTLLIGTGFRMLIAMWWLGVPSEKHIEGEKKVADVEKGKAVERGNQIEVGVAEKE